MQANVMDLRIDIMNEHREVFPNANKATQALKYLEELVEFNDATTNEERLDELCDVFIVGCGMNRFDSKYSKFICEKSVAIMEIYFKCETDEDYKKNIYDRIKNSWDIKKKRPVKEIAPGEYRHLEDL
jgi:hypothetical protein